MTPEEATAVFERLRQRVDAGEFDDLHARAPLAWDVLARLASLQTVDHREAVAAFVEVGENAPDLLDEFRVEYESVARFGLVLPFTASEREQLSREATREMHEWIAAESLVVVSSAPQSHTGRLGGGRRRGSTSRRRHRCASRRSPDDPHDLARPGGCRSLRRPREGRA